MWRKSLLPLDNQRVLTIKSYVNEILVKGTYHKYNLSLNLWEEKEK